MTTKKFIIVDTRSSLRFELGGDRAVKSISIEPAVKNNNSYHLSGHVASAEEGVSRPTVSWCRVFTRVCYSLYQLVRPWSSQILHWLACPSHPCSRNPWPSHPWPSHPWPSHPWPSHPWPSYPWPSHPCLRHPGPSHPCPCLPCISILDLASPVQAILVLAKLSLAMSLACLVLVSFCIACVEVVLPPLGLSLEVLGNRSISYLGWLGCLPLGWWTYLKEKLPLPGKGKITLGFCKV